MTQARLQISPPGEPICRGSVNGNSRFLPHQLHRYVETRPLLLSALPELCCLMGLVHSPGLLVPTLQDPEAPQRQPRQARVDVDTVVVRAPLLHNLACKAWSEVQPGKPRLWNPVRT